LLYADNRSGGFDNQVYEPFGSAEELAALQPKSAGDEVYLKGRKVYQNACQVCHQASGLGAPGQFPPLAGSDWVLVEHPNRIIRLVLNGIAGPIEVNGQAFNNVMPPWKDVLSDDDIAAVLTYVRRQKDWKNTAAEVKPETVKAIREKTKDRSDPWSAAELLAIPLGAE
jgi:mono/diheme cytochrome c family protein